MDKIIEKLFKEFGDNLQNPNSPSEKRNKKELVLCEKFEKTLSDGQTELFDELMSVIADNQYEENLLSFESGLKLGIKLSQLENE